MPYFSSTVWRRRSGAPTRYRASANYNFAHMFVEGTLQKSARRLRCVRHVRPVVYFGILLLFRYLSSWLHLRSGSYIFKRERAENLIARARGSGSTSRHGLCARVEAHDIIHTPRAHSEIINSAKSRFYGKYFGADIRYFKECA